MERVDNERGPVQALDLNVDGSKKGRLKKRWRELVEKDMIDRGLKMMDAQDRLLWVIWLLKPADPCLQG